MRTSKMKGKISMNYYTHSDPCKEKKKGDEQNVDDLNSFSVFLLNINYYVYNKL